jgi:hypothetical protein
MSDKPHFCEECKCDCRCEAVTRVEENREDIFAVAWKCPVCARRFLIVSPIGGAPRAQECLQCGHQGVSDAQPCPACGMVLSQVLSAEEQGRPEAQQLREARDAFALGACRRGLTIVNFVLRRNHKSQEAWSIKSQFMEHLGFRNACAAVVRQSKPWWHLWK